MSRQIFVPGGGPPQTERPDPAIFESMGEERIKAMVHEFYGELAKSSIREMFAADIAASADRAAAFFIGLLGGPPRYQEQYGQPMLRARHMPFPIDAAAREIWLGCFRRVLERAPGEYNFPSEHLPGFINFLDGFSQWMVNTE